MYRRYSEGLSVRQRVFFERIMSDLETAETWPQADEIIAGARVK
jgi:hypothetical protein